MASVRVLPRAKGAMYTALYRDPSGRQRSAGTFTSGRAAIRAARRAESSIETGTWISAAAGRTTFREYVETTWPVTPCRSLDRGQLPVVPGSPLPAVLRRHADGRNPAFHDA